MNANRTIQEVLDIESGRVLYANELLTIENEEKVTKLRHLQQNAFKKRNPVRLICLECEKPVFILGSGGFKYGRSGKIWHFKHFSDANECPYNSGKLTDSSIIRRIKYNGAKESRLHKESKQLLLKYLSLNPYVSHILQENQIRSKLNLREWRQPDVQAKFKTYHLAFEVQISTDFVSVILDRAHFYKENNMHLIWVMRKFSIDWDERTFTQNDISNSNNMNVFVLDDEAIEKSEEVGDLVLHCYYREYIPNSIPKVTWESEFVTLADLKFHSKENTVFFYDYEENKKKYERNNIIDSVREYFPPYSENLKNTPEDRKIVADLANSEETITKFIALFTFADLPLRGAITNLFERNYTFKPEDSLFVKKCYNRIKKIDAIPVETECAFNSLTFATYYLKYQMASLNIKKIYSIQALLNSISSLKHQRIIGFGFKKLIEVAHKMFDYRPQYLDVFLQASKQYDAGKLLMEQDKKNILRKRIEEFKKNPVPQDKNAKLFLEPIFPELFSKHE
jgi:competence CoiA-like predicted nuclease